MCEKILCGAGVIAKAYKDIDDFMNNTDEKKAEIRNKLQSPKTALELLSQGKDVPREFIKKALKDLDEVVKMLVEA